MDDWYDNIEIGVCEAVRLLRNNGFNTEDSCGHERTIQCQYVPEGEIQRLHNLLFNAGHRNYSITVDMEVSEGHTYASMRIVLPDVHTVSAED